jgi:phage/plasmid-like protein (TIGR03299 family)
MAHDLYIEKDGQAAMMYVGKTPWHGLGTRLEQPPTAAQAIVAAKLDWQVSKRRVDRLQQEPGSAIQERYVVVREDTNCVLGFVGSDYTPLQNREAFGFFDPIVGKGSAAYDTAGALGKGERVWIMAKFSDEMRVVGDDIVQKFLLLSNGHDGRSAVEIRLTPVRVVCQNTLTLASFLGPSLRISHSRDIAERLVETAMLLLNIKLRYSDVEKEFKAMATRQLGKKDLQIYLQQVFPDPQRQNPARQDDDQRYERSRALAQLDRLLAERLFDLGAGNDRGPAKGTLWAAYNGVTEYIDHRRYNHLPMQSRWEHLWFGMGQSAKARAYQTASRMLHGSASSSLQVDAIAQSLARWESRPGERSLNNMERSAIRRALGSGGRSDNRAYSKKSFAAFEFAGTKESA